MSAGTARNSVAQKPPRAGLDLTGFPGGGQPEDSMFRAHSREFDPWFFASHENGRFNLADPNGTCYFAGGLETAVREYYGELVVDTNALSTAAAAMLRVSVVHPPTGAVYAHVSGPGVSHYGITSELTTMGDYAITRAWAERLKDDANGLRYNSRFNPGHESWALFGKAGPAPSLGVEPSRAVDGVAAVTAAGIAVLPDPPRKSSVRLVSDPRT